MIKVCHIVNHITGKADGVYSHIKMILSQTDHEKFRYFLIYQGGEKVEKEISEMGVKVFTCASLQKKISVKAFIEISEFIKENDIDIIHAHLVKPYAIAGLLNILLRKKLIFNYNGLFIYRNPYYNIFEKYLYGLIHTLINLFKAVDAVLVPSKKSRELVLSETSLFPEPIIYYNTFEMKKDIQPDKDILTRIYEIKKRDLIIAVAARLERQKRIDRALELFAEIHKQNNNISLLIFGDGNLKESLQSKAMQYGISDKVFFFDFVQDVSSCFFLFDILLFTSEWEGLPLTLWEAMANKLPVVAPDVGGFKEIIEENNSGLIFTPGDIKDAREKLLRLINNSSLRNELGENGFIALKTKYTLERFRETIEKVYTDLVS